MDEAEYQGKLNPATQILPTVEASQELRAAVVPTSQNGYPANNRSLIVTLTAGGVQFPVRKGACGELLMWAAERWHREVEPLVPGTCWGYAERDIIGGTVISNHASGTAIDINAPQHPLATNPAGNFSPAQLSAVRRIIADTQGALRWGGDYVGRKDGMHVEINAPEGHVAGVLAQVTGGADVAPQTAQQIDEIHQQVTGVLNAWDGGITDNQKPPTPYNMLQHILRISVATNQTAMMVEKLTKAPAPQVRLDVDRLAGKLGEHPALQALVAPAEEIVTVSFWRAAGERAAKSFAGAALTLFGAGPLDVLHIDWESTLSLSAGAAVVSVLMSLASSQIGTPGSPSLLKGAQ
jgi:hypothetical protein